ncbi:MAG: GntR family transcriptional regulator [Lachnospiraceae bacterium]|nr:GntR family transcriptional regulator [Lachnospiraceae bacterium]
MAWEFKNDRPIYAQILEHMEFDILSGKYSPGEKVPSVRELAADAAVNPNTMQRAMVELERRGLVYTERTNGRFITENMDMLQDVKRRIAEEYIGEFVDKMKKIGYSEEEVKNLMQNHMNYERNEENG